MPDEIIQKQKKFKDRTHPIPISRARPKTEYDLYKQLPKLSHGTIHFCLNKLTQYGSITYTKNNNKKTNKETIPSHFHWNGSTHC